MRERGGVDQTPPSTPCIGRLVLRLYRQLARLTRSSAPGLPAGEPDRRQGSENRALFERDPKVIKDRLADLNPEARVMDGFDAALIGIVYRKLLDPIALYDRSLCIQVLVDHGMEWDEAEEYFSYNCDDAWVGEGTPAFLLEVDDGPTDTWA